MAPVNSYLFTVSFTVDHVLSSLINSHVSAWIDFHMRIDHALKLGLGIDLSLREPSPVRLLHCSMPFWGSSSWMMHQKQPPYTSITAPATICMRMSENLRPATEQAAVTAQSWSWQLGGCPRSASREAEPRSSIQTPDSARPACRASLTAVLSHYRLSELRVRQPPVSCSPTTDLGPRSRNTDRF